MSFRILLLTVFLATNILGSVWTMPMGFAQESQMPKEYQEMVMTPIVPMSPMDCTGCVTVQSRTYNKVEQAKRAACGSGHCLSGAQTPIVGTTVQKTREVSKIVPLDTVIPVRSFVLIATATPPIKRLNTHTIVLRQ